MTIPEHVAIIMDGNRRWARKHKLSLLLGHQTALDRTIEPIVDAAISVGVSYLTLWAFSTENWQRDKQEVEGLLNLFREKLTEKIDRLNKKGVRFRTIGDISKFPLDIQKRLISGEMKTKGNKKITVIFALNYGGRDEIVRAIKKMSNVTVEQFSQHLDTAGIPDPDLIIRTGGEKRLSGFLLWQGAYAELYFTDILFPDFTPQEFKKAIADYQHRERRFGR